jgi:hypothetical protein
MNTMSLAILAIASSLAMLLLSPASKNTQAFTPIPHKTDNLLWDDQAVNWLLEAQSPNGGWGAGSHAYQNVTDPHAVQTDPATTAFAALALLKSGGPLKSNPYQQQIEKALDRILKGH